MSNHAKVDSILDMVFEELNKVKRMIDSHGDVTVDEEEAFTTIYHIGANRWHDLRAKVHYFYGGDRPTTANDSYPKESVDYATLPPFMR